MSDQPQSEPGHGKPEDTPGRGPPTPEERQDGVPGRGRPVTPPGQDKPRPDQTLPEPEEPAALAMTARSSPRPCATPRRLRWTRPPPTLPPR